VRETPRRALESLVTVAFSGPPRAARDPETPKAAWSSRAAFTQTSRMTLASAA